MTTRMQRLYARNNPAPAPPPVPRAPQKPLPSHTPHPDFFNTLRAGQEEEQRYDETAIYTFDEIQRFQDLMLAVNARLGPPGVYAADPVLRPLGQVVPTPGASSIQSWEELVVIADDLGIDISFF